MISSIDKEEWSILENRKIMLFLFIVFSIYFLWHITTYPLIEPDEGRYAQIPLEMLGSGDWVTPRLHNLLYFEKPALGYWLNAISFFIFGKTVFAARLATAIYTVAGIYGVYYLVRKSYNEVIANLAAIITATSSLYYIIGSINILDMGLSFWCELTIISFIRYIQTRKRKFIYLLYISLALGVLTKGLVAIILGGGIIFIYLIWSKNWNIFKELLFVPAIASFFAIVLPWFIAVSIINPSFAFFFFIHEHFMRYLEPIHSHNEPFYYFLVILIIGLFPWTGYFLANLTKINLLKFKSKLSDTSKIIIIASIFPLIFFSLSDSQLASYILPIIPFIAIIIAKSIISYTWSTIKLLIATIINIILSASIVIFGYLYSQSFQYVLLQREFIVLAINLIIGNTLILAFVFKNIKYMILVNAIMAGIFLITLQPVFNEVGNRRSMENISHLLNQTRYQNSTLVNYKNYYETLTFYTNKTPLICDYYGELAFGASQDKNNNSFIDSKQLAKKWDKEDIVIISNKKYLQNLMDLLPKDSYKIIDYDKLIIIEKK